jgi:hypothetical protein
VNDRDGEEYEGILMGCSHFCVWLDFSLSALAIDITMGRYMHPSPRHRSRPRSGIVPKLETAVIRGQSACHVSNFNQPLDANRSSVVAGLHPSPSLSLAKVNCCRQCSRRNSLAHPPDRLIG